MQKKVFIIDKYYFDIGISSVLFFEGWVLAGPVNKEKHKMIQ